MLYWLKEEEMSVQELLQRVECVITHIVLQWLVDHEQRACSGCEKGQVPGRPIDFTLNYRSSFTPSHTDSLPRATWGLSDTPGPLLERSTARKGPQIRNHSCIPDLKSHVT
ncbi:unnamed protein product [Arctogadus glacialis]